MPNIIRIKRSASAANVPATSSLLHGELALNTADNKLYYGKVDGTTGVLANGDMLRSVYDKDANGIIDVAALGTGTPTASTYLNGAGAWAAGSSAASYTPPPPPAGIIMPLYVFPSDIYNNVMFNALIALLKKYRGVPVYVVLNPSDGTGTVVSTQPDYVGAIRRVRGAGATVLGYLDSNYNANTSAQILAQAQSYATYYPTAMPDGYFIDRVSAVDTQPPVDAMVATTRALHGQGFYPIIGNAGAAQPERYFSNPAADCMIISENLNYPTQAVLQGNTAGGSSDYNPRGRGVIVYGQAFNNANVELMRQYTGLIYTTTATGSNPYAVVSPDLEKLLQSVVASQSVGLGIKVDPNNDGLIAPSVLGTGTPSASTFLNGAGAWATPPTATGGGGGDMLRSVYDANLDGHIDVGALGTNTPTATSYLRGDGTWAGVARGSSSIPATATSVTITHGLGAIPRFVVFQLTSNLGTAQNMERRTMTSTTFVAAVDVAPGGAGITFDWRAEL